MNKMKSTAYEMLIMAAALGEGNGIMFEGVGHDVRKVRSLKESPIPKGAKEYFFNEFGGFSTEQMPKYEVIFKCIAINDKNAIKKFNRYKSISQ